MRLEQIYVSNYKSISPKGITINFHQGLAVMVGKNNAGKSNILEAVGYLLGYKNPRLIFKEALRRKHSEILEADYERIHKLTPKCYSQTTNELREEGDIKEIRLKTGDALSKWLKKSKPEIPQLIAEQILNGGTVPGNLGGLVRWLLKDMERE